MTTQIKIDHAMSVLASFKKLRDEGFNCDFTIKVGTESFKVHRNVLIACSDYFKAMFSHNTKEAECGFVDMKDVEKDGVEQCINFMYSGEAAVTLANAQHVLHTAALMQLHLLTGHCFEVLLNDNLNEENCLQVRALANMYSHEKAKTKIDNYVKNSFAQLIKTQSFLELDLCDVSEMINDDMVDHEVLWSAITSWVGHNEEIRKEHFTGLVQVIKFTQLSFPFLVSTVWGCPLLQGSEDCKCCVVDCLFSDVSVLTRYINSQNCFLIQEIAKKFLSEGGQTPLIMKVINDFMQTNFERIALEPRFAKMSQSDVENLFEAVQSSQWHQLHTDKVKWIAALKWVKQDSEHKKSALPVLMKLIKFEWFPSEYFKTEVMDETLVKECHACKDILMNVLFEKTRKNTLDLSVKSFQAMKPDLSSSASSQQGPTINPVHFIAVLDKKNKEIRGFDIASNEWTAIADAPVSNSGFDFIVTLDNDIYLIHNKLLYVLQCDLTWEMKADISFKHDRSTRVVAFKKHINVVSCSTLAHYNPHNNQWTESYQPGNFMGGFCLVATASSMYAIGGWTGFSCSDQMLRYEPCRTAWTCVQPMYQERSNASAQHYLDNIFVMGGRFTDLILDSVESYCISSDQWTCIQAMEAPRANFASCVIEGKLYAVGGQDSVEVYDIDDDEWNMLERINSRPFGLSACSVKCWMVSRRKEGNVTNTLIL